MEKISKGEGLFASHFYLLCMDWGGGLRMHVKDLIGRWWWDCDKGAVLPLNMLPSKWKIFQVLAPLSFH